MEKIYYKDNKITTPIYKNIDDNINFLTTIFDRCDDLVKKEFNVHRQDKDVRLYFVYTDGLSDSLLIGNTIISPILWEWKESSSENIWDDILKSQVETVDIIESADYDKVVTCALRGDTVIFVDGYDKAMIVSTKKYPLRSVSESKTEAVLRGPRDSFNESIRSGTALIRRRIRDPKLKAEHAQVGVRSKTDYALMYMDDLVDPILLKQIKEKINQYEIDGIFDSGMLEHLMEEKWYSPFPEFQSTERPDKVASSILEGRIALVIDNSPEVILLPATFNTFFQASDDYYNRWTEATFARILRYIAAIIAIGLPGLYIAITTFHTEVLPTNLLLAIATARAAVTFPVMIEVLIMELEFELLREAGIRLPGQMGNTIGVVGGLIIGQAAVEAGLVSTIVVIVVALTAISSFAIPNEAFSSIFRLLKFFIIITSAIWGIYGFLLGMLVILIHLSGLASFGIPYMMPAVSATVNNYNDEKDFILKLPIFTMKDRPIFTIKGNRRKLKNTRK